MNWKTWAPLAVAVVLGLVAAITARNLVSRRPAVVAGASGPQVVIVKQPVMPGQEITANDVVAAPLAWKERPEGTFKDVTEVVGRIATAPLVKGQPVLEALLASPGSGSGLQALVPDGMRAITIEVNESSSVGGLVLPGCSVDVVATVEDAKIHDRVARTIVQAVKVMAIGQRVGNAPATPASKDAPPVTPDQLFKSVTLLTTPSEAEALELASMIGRPRLVLRGSRDSADAKTSGVSIAQLVGRSEDATLALLEPAAHATGQPAALLQAMVAPATRPAAAYDQQIVKVLRGGVESTVTFNVPRTPATESQPGPTQDVYTGTDYTRIVK